MDLPVVRWVAKPPKTIGLGMELKATNAKCMGDYANSYYNKYLTLNAPDPDDWMVKHHSNECMRNIVDYKAID